RSCSLMQKPFCWFYDVRNRQRGCANYSALLRCSRTRDTVSGSTRHSASPRCDGTFVYGREPIAALAKLSDGSQHLGVASRLFPYFFSGGTSSPALRKPSMECSKRRRPSQKRADYLQVDALAERNADTFDA